MKWKLVLQWLIHSTSDEYNEKKNEIWLSPMMKASIPTENLTNNWQHINNISVRGGKYILHPCNKNHGIAFIRGSFKMFCYKLLPMRNKKIHWFCVYRFFILSLIHMWDLKNRANINIDNGIQSSISYKLVHRPIFEDEKRNRWHRKC